MNNTYTDNWQAIKDRFEQWWSCEPWDKPLMYIVAAGKTTVHEKPQEDPAGDPHGEDPSDQRYSEKYLNVRRIIGEYRHFCETHYFLADAFPTANINLGPGSMALYLGGEPIFTRDTVWYKEKCAKAGEFRSLSYNHNNTWWKIHQQMMKEARKLSKEDFFVAIPDIIENLDILSALRGPQNLCFDIMDDPEAVREGVKIIDGFYFNYYDRCYELLADEDYSSSYTAFNILGKGKIAKIQCDFCALISPESFMDFVQPSLTKQCRELNHSIYHLDGPDAIKHVPALMEIKELDALQWTCGAGKPDGGSPDWYPIYDQVRAAGKGLWISIHDGDPKDWAQSARRLVKRYGATGLYFLFPVFPDLAQAEDMAALFD